MFDDLVESSVVRKKTNTGWAVILSTIVQIAVLIVLILIPLIYTQALPKAMMATLLVAPPPPPPPPPPPTEAPKVIKPVARLIQQGKLVQPRAIPKEVAVFKEAELPPEAPVTGGGVLGGVDQGLLGGLGAGPAVAAPPPPPKQQRIKLGGQVVAAKLLAQPQPVYPPLARQARIQGNVVLHAIIDKDGRVGELQVVSGHPLLVQAALEAVKNWRYQPTQLNGDAVEVDTTITVTFVLGG
jgi:periplasmic protein TonB